MRRRKPVPLILTRHLIYEPTKGLVWDRRTYYDTRPICMGRLDDMNEFRSLPTRELKEEWLELRLEAYRVRARREAQR